MQLHDIRLITPDSLSRVIGLLKTTFTHVIIDTSKSYSDLDFLAFEESDDVLMVTQLDLPCLRNVVRLLATFEENPSLRDKVKIIVNRMGQNNGQISLKKAQDTIGRKIFAQLPNDYRVMIEVRNNGVPLLEHAPKAPVTQAIGQLARALCGPGQGDEQDDSKTRRWLGLWPARS